MTPQGHVSSKDKQFLLAANENATALQLVVDRGAATGVSLTAAVLEAARTMKLAVPVDEAAVKTACAAAFAGEAVRVAIARGTAPVDGEDARLIWSKKILGADHADTPHSHYLGRIEKRIVSKDDPLAKLTKETAGVTGSDLYGKTLKARSGKPLKLKAGANIREKDGIFFAEKAGMVRVNAGQMIIDEVFIAEKTVDFEIGNVDFPGSVIVNGGVLDLFEIKAGGAIQINGLVEAAKLRSGGDIEVKAGIAGKRKGVVRAGGSVSAKYLLNAEVYARSDVIVETQIITSVVMTLGALKAPKGTIAGGEVVALAGIEAHTIGSESAAPTSVAAGINYTLDGIVAEVDKTIADCNKRLAAIGRGIEELKHSVLTPQAREKMAELESARAEVQGEIAAAEARKNDAVALTHRLAVPVILVHGMLYPGVVIRLGDCKAVVNRPVTGPLKIAPERSSGTVRFLPGS